MYYMVMAKTSMRTTTTTCLTQNIGRPVPRHEARVVSITHALLQDAFAEVLAEAATGCH